jgi:hypothetical protein
VVAAAEMGNLVGQQGETLILVQPDPRGLGDQEPGSKPYAQSAGDMISGTKQTSGTRLRSSFWAIAWAISCTGAGAGRTAPKRLRIWTS